MTQRSYNIDPILYQDFKTICTAEGTTATDIIQGLIADYVSENKNAIHAKSTETKRRFNIPKLYDENLKWNEFAKSMNDGTILDVWHRIIFLHSLIAKQTRKYDIESEVEFQIFAEKNPFEKTVDYEFLKSRKIPIIGYTLTKK